MVHPLGFEPKTLALEGRCSIQLSYGCTKNIIINNKTDLLNGTPERTRTSNPQIRSLMLYPIEPQALHHFCIRVVTQLIINGVGDGTRTRDNQYHKLALYQLNYAHHN